MKRAPALLWCWWVVCVACSSASFDLASVAPDDDAGDVEPDVHPIDVAGDELRDTREPSTPETASGDVAGDAADTSIDPAPETTPQLDTGWSVDGGAGDASPLDDTSSTSDAGGDASSDASDAASETKADAGDVGSCRKETELCMTFGPCCPGLKCSPLIGVGCVK